MIDVCMAFCDISEIIDTQNNEDMEKLKNETLLSAQLLIKGRKRLQNILNVR